MGRMGLAAEEAVVPVVEGVTELRTTTKWLQLTAGRIKTKIFTPQGERFCLGIIRWTNFPTILGASSINSVINTPSEVIEAALCFFRSKTGEHFPANIGAMISVRILQVPNIWRCRHENTLLPDRDSGWPHQPIGEHVTAIKLAITVSIFQQSNPTQGR